MVVMDKQTITFVKKERVADGTMAFFFTKPDGFTYKPGQYIELTLINPKETDDEGDARVFSLVSTPKHEYLEVAIRMRDSAFKRCLGNLKESEEILLDGPFGAFLLHQDTNKRAVFLVGGIGITPIMSMVRSAEEEKIKRPMTLVLSTRTLGDAPFLSELHEKKENKIMDLLHTVTNEEVSGQDLEHGYISSDMLKKNLTDIDTCIFYVVGPPAMVRAMNKVLEELEVSPDNIKMEEFAGYEKEKGRTE